ncbi:potassium channel subfamily K member 6 [Rhinoraja longicauda]
MAESYCPPQPLVFLSLFYLCYLLLGALTVSLVERPHEHQLRSELRVLKSHLLNSSRCLAEAELEDFLSRVLRANAYGISVLSNASQHTNWDFASAFFFASTLVTTVGYGHTTPLSDGGKAFSVIFALMGVPLTMLLLTVLVQRLLVYVTTRPIRLCQQRLGYSKQQVAVVHLLILGLVILLAFFIIPSAIFSAIEHDWTFLDAFYFCFISLTTVGLGDFVPGEQSNQQLRPLYKLSVSFFLLCGLAVMILFLQTLYKVASLHGLTQIFNLPPCEYDEGQEEEEVEGDMCEGTVLHASQPDHTPKAPPSYDSILPLDNR